MLKRIFNPMLAYLVVAYLRMSSDQQNRRSPEQQLAEVERTLKALGYNWTIVKVYRDDAKSGRYLRNRKQYQRMLQDIKTGAVQADLVLVDTLERFGRVEELPTIRKELYEKHGVLVLTADTNFADPTTPQGKALGAFEAMRSSEDGRIKAHNVLRGKRDAAQLGHWPGGSPPFGLKLENVMKCVKGRQEVDHSILVRDPETNWIVRRLFKLAYRTGWGQAKLARCLNEDPIIPARHKPFHPSSIGYWLENEIYSGELVWPQNCTGIVDDMRVVEPIPEEEIIHVRDFCRPTICRQRQEAIRRVRRARREAILQARAPANDGNGKLIRPPAPGRTLKYLLSGLVRCGHCERAMDPTSSGAYITKAGESKRYPAYFCPASISGACPNSTRVPEEWLRKVVIGTVRQRLFPGGEQGDAEPDWLAMLVEEVRHELTCMEDTEPDPHQAFEQELTDLQEKQAGWSLSLANRDLNPALRAVIEADWEKALARQQEIKRLLAEREHRHERVEDILDTGQVLDCLRRLPEVLALNNPTLGNLELSLHIDRIDCFQDGKIVMRTCRLGALTGAADMLAKDDNPRASAPLPEGDGTRRSTPRRRARLRVDGGPAVKAAANTAADPNRFAGLDEQWFWTDEFVIPDKPLSWAAANAEAVFMRRQEAQLSYAKLGQEFGVTAPTARAAVRSYLAEHLEAKDEVNLRRGGQRPPKFVVSEFGREARELWESGWPKLKLAERFGCSTPTIDKALAWAYEQDGAMMPNRKDQKAARIASARAMLDEGRSLEEIAQTLGVSDVTARAYLRDSFAAEGKTMPDLRSKRRPSREI